MQNTRISLNKGMMAVILCFALLCSSLGTGANVVTAATKKIKINKKKVTLTIGGSYKLKITGPKKKLKKKKITWKSSKKSVATVSASGKVKAKKKGTATITAKVAGKKYKCKVTVQASKTDEQTVLKIVNQKRAAAGLNALKMDSKLQKAAKARAKELVKKLDHVRPNGKSCFTILDDYKITYRISSENIAAGQSSAEKVMAGWVSSAQHNAAIMNKEYTRIGIGLYKDPKSKYKYYWVQIFAD